MKAEEEFGELQAELSKRGLGLGRPLLVYEEAGSTNDLAKERATAGASEGWTIVAGRQTRGRGQQGRVWQSDSAGGLYMSVLLRPRWPAQESERLAILGGVSVFSALEILGVRRLSLKWPNDVLAGGKKIAGILVEPRVGQGLLEFAVMGLGVNVGQQAGEWTGEVSKTATSCALEGVSVTRSMVALRVLEQLDVNYKAIRRGRYETLLSFWAEKGGRQPGREHV